MKTSFKPIKDFLYKFIYPSATLFTVLTLLVCLGSNLTVKLSTLYIFLFLSFALTAANLILKIEKMNLYFRVATHFLLLGGVLFLTVYMSGYMAHSANWVLILIIYAVLYAILAPIFLFIRWKRIRKEKTDTTYKKLY